MELWFQSTGKIFSPYICVDQYTQIHTALSRPHQPLAHAMLGAVTSLMSFKLKFNSNCVRVSLLSYRHRRPLQLSLTTISATGEFKLTTITCLNVKTHDRKRKSNQHPMTSSQAIDIIFLHMCLKKLSPITAYNNIWELHVYTGIVEEWHELKSRTELNWFQRSGRATFPILPRLCCPS